MVEWRRDDFCFPFYFPRIHQGQPWPPVCGATPRWQDPISASLKCRSLSFLSRENVEAECLNTDSSFFPELNSHFPLPGQGWLLQVSYHLPLQDSSNSLWQGLSEVLLQHHCTKIISQKPGPGGVCSQIIQGMIFACLGSSWGSEMLPGLCRQGLCQARSVYLSQWSGLWTKNVKPWHSLLLQS